jgi:hypothetical protein
VTGDQPPIDLLAGMVDGAWLDRTVFPPLDWAVEGILPEGLTILAGAPKAGKSWFVGGLGLACAAGGYALGQIKVEQRPVLYFALEDGHRRLQQRFRTILEFDPLPKAMHVIIKAHSAIEMLAMMAEWLGRHSDATPLVILDTLGKIKPPKRPGEDAYGADYAIGSRLKATIDTAPGASLLVVHHTRKATSDDFVDSVSGTQGVAGSADSVLRLDRKRQSDEAVLSVTGRDVTEAEYALSTSGGRWTLDGEDLADAAAAIDRRKAAARLADRSVDALAFVADRPSGTRPADLAEHLGIDQNQAGTYLRRLTESGRIRKQGRGLYVPMS